MSFRKRPSEVLYALKFAERALSLFHMEYIGESERQASPEKLYRAALLRSRFADTIVKAREKLFTQVGYFAFITQKISELHLILDLFL